MTGARSPSGRAGGAAHVLPLRSHSFHTGLDSLLDCLPLQLGHCLATEEQVMNEGKCRYCGKDLAQSEGRKDCVVCGAPLPEAA
jgi:hypothetical protein